MSETLNQDPVSKLQGAEVVALPCHGSALFGRVIAPTQDALMHKIWDAFPWMVDAFTGRFDDARYDQIGAWLHGRFGREASPIHGIDGKWQRGGATINGYTWIGFATEEMMTTFEKFWPNTPDEIPQGRGERG